jgi:hypothetical protein
VEPEGTGVHEQVGHRLTGKGFGTGGKGESLGLGGQKVDQKPLGRVGGIVNRGSLQHRIRRRAHIDQHALAAVWSIQNLGHSNRGRCDSRGQTGRLQSRYLHQLLRRGVVAAGDGGEYPSPQHHCDRNKT